MGNSECVYCPMFHTERHSIPFAMSLSFKMFNLALSMIIKSYRPPSRDVFVNKMSVPGKNIVKASGQRAGAANHTMGCAGYLSIAVAKHHDLGNL